MSFLSPSKMCVFELKLIAGMNCILHSKKKFYHGNNIVELLTLLELSATGHKIFSFNDQIMGSNYICNAMLQIITH